MAFEVDELDEFTRSGTSVIVEGTADAEVGRGDLPPGVDTWPAGNRPFVVGIEVSLVTGRRLLPS